MRHATAVIACTKDPVLSESIRLPSTDGVELEAYLAQPAGTQQAPGVLLLHGFPSDLIVAEHIGSDLPELADRIADQMGWVSLAIRFRGCGSSTGQFSLNGWVEDVHAGLEALRANNRSDRIWICGTGTGGSLGMIAAVTEPDVAGVATMGSPGGFADWASQPDRLLQHARDVGAISAQDFPSDLADWKAQLRSARPATAAEALFPTPLLVLHGGADEVVPQFDARVIADAHSAADLRIIEGVGHQVRHDPRAVAVLLGWLERQRRS